MKKANCLYEAPSLCFSSGLLPYFAQNPFNSIKFENFLCGLISVRYKTRCSSNQEDAIILITNYHAKNTPKIWQYPLFSLLLQKEFKKQLGYGTKVQKDTGMCEVLIRFFQGSKFNLRAKSGVFVSPEYFEYYIDRAKTESLGVKVPGNLLTATEEKAKKSHYVLRQSGIIVIKQRIETPEVKYHREQSGRLDSLRKAIIEAYDNNKDTNLTSDWLQLVVERFMHPEKYIVKAENKKTFYELTEEYIEKRHLAYTHAKVFRVLMREVATTLTPLQKAI